MQTPCLPHTPTDQPVIGRTFSALLGLISSLGIRNASSAPWHDLFSSLYHPLSVAGPRLSVPPTRTRPLPPRRPPTNDSLASGCFSPWSIFELYRTCKFFDPPHRYLSPLKLVSLLRNDPSAPPQFLHITYLPQTQSRRVHSFIAGIYRFGARMTSFIDLERERFVVTFPSHPAPYPSPSFLYPPCDTPFVKSIRTLN